MTTKESARGSDYQLKLSNEAAKSVLGMKFRPLKQAAIDMIESMIKAGKIAPSQNAWIEIENPPPRNLRNSQHFSSMLTFDDNSCNE